MIGNVSPVRLARMPHTELPRALEDYFAFAETEPTRNGRRFSITLPYMDGERLDRLQWWYHVSLAQEQMYEGTGLTFYRNLAIERFRRHIERWLDITAQRFHGNEPIPRLTLASATAVEPEAGVSGPQSPYGSDSSVPSRTAIEGVLLPVDKVANG